jgi:hypothetical protein
MIRARAHPPYPPGCRRSDAGERGREGVRSPGSAITNLKACEPNLGYQPIWRPRRRI